MKKFISSITVLTIMITLISCETERINTDSNIEKNAKEGESNFFFNRGIDSSATKINVDEEPRRDPQQWRTQP